MGNIIAIMNRKGGVGKTTTAIALADTFAAERKQRVMVVDLDPQASASMALLGEEAALARAESKLDLAGYLHDLLAGRTVSLDDVICNNIKVIKEVEADDYALIPSSELLWDVEHTAIANLHLGRLKDAIADMLNTLRASYDVIILDCPPGKAQSAERAIQIADLILCPTVPDRVSVWGINSFSRYIKTMTDGRPIKSHLVVTKFDARNKEHARFCAALTEQPPENISVLLDDDPTTPPASAKPAPLVIHQDVRLPRRLEHAKPSSFNGFYGKSGTRDLTRLANAVARELLKPATLPDDQTQKELA